MPASPSYKHEEEGHPTDVVRNNKASQGAAAGDAGGTAGDDVGGGSRTNSLVGIVGILGRSSIGTDHSSVEFLKSPPALTADLTYTSTFSLLGSLLADLGTLVRSHH